MELYAGDNEYFKHVEEPQPFRCVPRATAVHSPEEAYSASKIPDTYERIVDFFDDIGPSPYLQAKLFGANLTSRGRKALGEAMQQELLLSKRDKLREDIEKGDANDGAERVLSLATHLIEQRQADGEIKEQPVRGFIKEISRGVSEGLNEGWLPVDVLVRYDGYLVPAIGHFMDKANQYTCHPDDIPMLLRHTTIQLTLFLVKDEKLDIEDVPGFDIGGELSAHFSPEQIRMMLG